MNDVVLQIESLGKKYRIRHETHREKYTAMRDVLAKAARTLGRSAQNVLRGRRPPLSSSEFEDFWALRDVSFSVRRGEVVGILGHNGAGKSTLLKILSRITEPSVGRVVIKGRIASLLEVGTGFHPELTGRENIFLNGCILGMTRAEITAKFDEIVAFADVERFLDTPVKRYSSGMYVRHAFAVAAHLEPETLIVDEVLAVGDASFQSKCLGKMRDVAGTGRTVIFVSHNISAIRQLCGRAVILSSGCLEFDGDTDRAVTTYLQGEDNHLKTGRRRSWEPDTGPGGNDLRLTCVELTGERSASGPFHPDERIVVAVTYRQYRPIRGLRVVLRVLTTTGDVAFVTTDESVRSSKSTDAGLYEKTRCTLPAFLFNRRDYIVQVNARVPPQKDLIPITEVARISVEGAGNDGSTSGTSNWPGVICPRVEWAVKSIRTYGTS